MSKSHSQPKSDSGITSDDAGRIGGRIRHIRGDANQKEFASRLGISREQLSRIESGVQVPGTETLRRLARVTNVPIDFILLGNLPSGARPAAVGASSSWEAALDPLLAGTMLSLPRAAVSSGRKVDRAWQQLSEERREEIRNFVRESDVRIFSVSVLGRSPSMERLAEESGGRAFHIHNLNELSALSVSMSALIHGEYVVGFSPAIGSRDGKYHPIKVALTQPEGLHASWRHGYYGPTQ